MPTQPTYDELRHRVKELEAELAACRSGPGGDPILRAIGVDSRHTGILDGLGEEVAILDRNFRLVYQNRIHQQRTGAHSGEHCYQVFHGRDAICDGCPAALTFGDHAIHTREMVVARESGLLSVEITASPLRDTAGRTVAVLEIIRDVTERRRMEAALRDSEAALRTTLTAAPVGIAQVGKDRIIKWVSAGMSDMLGYGPGELIGRCTQEIYLSKREFRRSGDTKWEQIRKTGIGETESQWQRKDGSVIEVLLRSAPIDANDPAAGVICTALDITDRKRAEKVLRDSEQKYRLLFQNATDAIFLADASSGLLLDANPKAEELTGRPALELIGRHQSELHPPEDKGFYAAVFQNRLVRNRDRDYFVQHRDGRRIPVKVSRSEAAFGDLQVVFGVFRDISEQKQAEEELLRTRKLESLGILAGGIAHDFNNLLTAIQGNISLVMTAAADAEMGQLLAEAEAATARARTLTGQLLTFAKGGEPIRKPLAMADLVQETVRFVLRGSKVGSLFEVATDLWLVAGDEGQLCQTLHNLVLNAIQAMPKGGMVTVRADNLDLAAPGSLPLPPGRYVRIVVTDQGTGISPAILDKIFDPYFSTKKNGSGLGLASAYSIVRRHGGHLMAASTLGRGSAFTILIPATDQVPVADARKQEPVKGSGRILVMDDELHVRTVASRMLARLGYEAETAADGHSAIETYRQALAASRPFVAVIADLTIPGGMGGKDAVKELLAIDPKLKAIASSGYANDPIMANHRQFGFTGVIPKPYDLAELGAMLQQLLA